MFAFVSSFAGASLAARPAQAISTRSPSTITMAAGKSKAIPFLEAPPALDGSMVGDAGFDPLYLSNYIDLKYAREGELKNGRIAMLAVLGFIVPSFVHLPGPYFSETRPLAAIGKVPLEGWAQIITVISLIELATFRSHYMEDREPGAFGFDPLGMGKPGAIEKFKLNELKNARLAMIAIMGFILQELVTGQGVVEQLTNFKSLA